MNEWLKRIRLGLAIGKMVATGKSKKLDKVLDSVEKGTEIGDKVSEIVSILHPKRPKT